MRCLRALAMLAAFGIGWSAWTDVAAGQGGVPSIQPRMGPGVGHGMILTIHVVQSNRAPRKPTTPVNNLQEFMGALAGCWNPPPVDKNRQPLDLNFTISFKRSGELFGKPRVVIFARPVTDAERERHYTAVAEAIDRCSPMPFTDSMGGAVAGRTFQINFIDMRNRTQV
jgi:hypothetical protein